MGDDSAIEWTDATWSPVVGCSRVSAGCQHCYAEVLAYRLAAMGQAKYQGLTHKVGNETRWTGEVRFVEEALSLPLRWKRPRRIFVNSMSDLFHEKVADEWIDRIFAVMALCPQHVFQVLTKRPERMRAYVTSVIEDRIRFTRWAAVGADVARTVNRECEAPPRWPLPNVHLGVSVENQETFDERVELLGRTPAALRFLSMEPLLEEIDCGNAFDDPPDDSPYGSIGWVIVGGESGPGARPMHPAWARSIRDQCAAAAVPYFFKQWGEWAPAPKRENGPGRMVRAGDVVLTLDGRRAPIRPDLSCDLEGEGVPMRRVGKKAAGALLDGREWRGFPR